MKRKGLSAVWRDAVRDSSLDSMAKLVALVLSTFMSGHGRAWPSRDTLAAGASVCDRTVDAALSRLEQSGFLVVERSKGGNAKTNRYQAVLPETANELRRSEWATAKLPTPNGEADDANGERASPESLESVESRTSARGRRGRAAQHALVENCQGCGARFETTDEDAVRCPSCEAGEPR